MIDDSPWGGPDVRVEEIRDETDPVRAATLHPDTVRATHLPSGTYVQVHRPDERSLQRRNERAVELLRQAMRPHSDRTERARLLQEFTERAERLRAMGAHIHGDTAMDGRLSVIEDVLEALTSGGTP